MRLVELFRGLGQGHEMLREKSLRRRWSDDFEFR